MNPFYKNLFTLKTVLKTLQLFKVCQEYVINRCMMYVCIYLPSTFITMLIKMKKKNENKIKIKDKQKY